MNGKPHLSFGLADNLNTDRAGLLHARSLISRIGIAKLNERPPGTRGYKQGHNAITILNARRVGLQLEPPPVGIHHGVPLASLDLLAAVIAAHAAAFGRLDALAVDHRSGWAGFAASTLAIEHHQTMVDRFPRSIVAEPREPAIHPRPRREVLRQEVPGNPAAQHVEDGVDDLAHLPLPMTARTRRAAAGKWKAESTRRRSHR